MNLIKKVINRIKLYKYKRAVSTNSVEKVFSNIYSSNIWYSNKESTSGAGSTLAATEDLRANLTLLLASLSCNVLIDIGCGDFNWMKEVKLPCKYIGIDIVKEVIEKNIKEYSNENITFLHRDAISEKLPVGCDVVLCREVLFHLSFDDARKLISNVFTSGAKYFVATTNDKIPENINIKTGQFRNINLLLPPFSLGPYVNSIKDDKVSKNRILACWKIRN